MEDHGTSTNPTIFLRLKSTDRTPRELAWNEFHVRYAPIIAAFARRLGATSTDVDDVVQDVLMGFYAKSPTFVYDRSQGRFRGYLRVCACRALHKRMGKNAQFSGQPLDQVDPQAVAVEQIWTDIWEKERLRNALEELRTALSSGKTFAAFEQYVIKGDPADAVAERLGLHVNSVYRAKEQVTGMLQQKLNANDDDD